MATVPILESGHTEKFRMTAGKDFSVTLEGENAIIRQN
jgi:hypothetical protein